MTLAHLMTRRRDQRPPSSSRSRTLPSRCLPKKFLGRRAPDVGSRSGGVEVPTGIKGLEALQTLGAVHVNTADGEAILDKIVNYLPQLKTRFFLSADIHRNFRNFLSIHRVR